MTGDWSLVVAMIALGVFQMVVFWIARQSQQAIQRIDDRMASLTASVSLLTDATECGLQDVGAEVQRLGAARELRPTPRAATQRRVTTAARRGRSVRDIAAAEQLSEGEVRLRLQLGKKAAAGKEKSDAGRNV